MKQPVHYSEEITAKILERICEGESLRTICQDEGMPTRRAVEGWVLTRDDFSNRYHQARQIQAMGWADEILDIADGHDDDPMRRRLRVDTRKWLLSKMLPKVYSDQVKLVGDKDNPIVLRAAQMSDDELLARAAEITRRIAIGSLTAGDDSANDDA